jgi:hypothetical protein
MKTLKDFIIEAQISINKQDIKDLFNDLSNLNNGNAVENAIEKLKSFAATEMDVKNPVSDLKKMNNNDVIIAINASNRTLKIVKKGDDQDTYYFKEIDITGSGSSCKAFDDNKILDYSDIKYRFSESFVKHINNKDILNLCYDLVNMKNY